MTEGIPAGSGWEDSRRPTIADVAAHAGVSVTTVSHVLSGNRPVAVRTQARVQRSVEQLGYRPNEIARSLRKQRTHTVAIIVPNIAHVVYPIMARGASDLLRPLGYNVALYDNNGGPDVELNVLRAVVDRITEGAILFGFSITRTDADVLTGVNIPFVNGGLNSDVDGPWDAVVSDQHGGIATATRHLVTRFGNSIGYLGGESDDGPAQVREAAFRQTMKLLDISVNENFVARAPYTYSGGREAMSTLFDYGELPRAIVTGNDRIANGAMRLARERGLAVPGDIAFTGYDNDDADQVVDPPLTSIETYLHEQGRTCAQVLVDRMSGAYSGPPRRLSLRTELIVRASSGE